MTRIAVASLSSLLVFVLSNASASAGFYPSPQRQQLYIQLPLKYSTRSITTSHTTDEGQFLLAQQAINAEQLDSTTSATVNSNEGTEVQFASEFATSETIQQHQHQPFTKESTSDETMNDPAPATEINHSHQSHYHNADATDSNTTPDINETNTPPSKQASHHTHSHARLSQVHQISRDSVDSTSTLTKGEKRELRNGKLAMIPIIFAMTLVSSSIPFLIARFVQKKTVTILSIASCWAAGIILGAAFNHMLVDSQEAFSTYWTEFKGKEEPFPLASTIAVAVLWLLIALDWIVIRGGLAHGHGHAHGSAASAGSGRGHGHMFPLIPDDYERVKSHVSATTDTEQYTSNTNNNNASNNQQLCRDHLQVNEATHAESNTRNVDITPPFKKDGEVLSVENSEVAVKVLEEDNAVSSPSLHPLQSRRLSLTGSKQDDLAQAWIFFFALAIHSIFDGMSVGSTDSLAGFYALLIAVVAHKCLDGFALGLPLLFAGLPRWHTVAALFFSAAMTPLGIGIGMAAADGYSGEQGQLSKAIILSMSTGSFVFISLMELLPSGLADGKWMKTKIGMATGGWAIMALLALWV